MTVKNLPVGVSLATITLALFLMCTQRSFCSDIVSEHVDSTEAEKQIQKLSSLWSTWRERTKTVKVAGYRFIGMRSKSEIGASREEVHKLFNDVLTPWLQAKVSASEAVTIESLDTLPVGTMFPRLAMGATTYGRVGTGWSQFEFLDGPSGRRTDHHSSAGQKTIVRSNGKEQKYSSLLGQVSLFPTESSERVESLEDFLYMPELKSLTRLEAPVPDRHILTNGDDRHVFRIEFNPFTGFVHHDVRGVAEQGYLMERLQGLPFNGNTELPVPRLLIRLSYQPTASGTTFLRKVTFYVVTAVDFNIDITPQDLKVGVPAGTVIADFENMIPSTTSKTGMGPTSRRIAEPTTDVMATAGDPKFRGDMKTPTLAAEADSGLRKHKRMAMVIINIVMLCVSAIWWKRTAR